LVTIPPAAFAINAIAGTDEDEEGTEEKADRNWNPKSRSAELFHYSPWSFAGGGSSRFVDTAAKSTTPGTANGTPEHKSSSSH